MALIIDMPKLLEIQASGLATRVWKYAPTYWRYSTREDVEYGLVSRGLNISPRSVIVQTLEGPKEMDEIICMGLDGELWPTSIKDFCLSKVISDKPSDIPGWRLSYNKPDDLCWAIQVDEDFTVTAGHSKPLSQKAGAYLLFKEKWAWPVAELLFPLYYRPV